MKLKLFLAAFMAFAIVSCSKNEQPVIDPVVDGDVAMLKVNLKSTNALTKAFEYGLETENAITSVDFYFYDVNGGYYSVVNGSNAITWNVNSENPGENVEKFSNKVLVIKKSKKTPPAKVVAVINSTADYTNKNLETLCSEVVGALHTNNTNFVMSNSVYYDSEVGAVMVATEITNDNFFTTANEVPAEPGEILDAKNITTVPSTINPVDIYVERVAAKVRVATGTTDWTFPVMKGQTQLVDSEGAAVYAKITGWNVTNATDEAYLVKNLSNDYSLSFNWNDPTQFRSYWANSTGTPEHKHTFTALEGHTPGYDYYFENTHATEKSQLLVAARLVNQAGENISLAKWYNVLYTVADAKTAMINSVAKKLFVKTTATGTDGTVTTTLTSVSVNDVEFYQQAAVADEKRYEVFVKAKPGVVYLDADAKEVVNADAVLGAIEPAQMWKEGMTYYYVTINHLEDEKGIVRNHIYDITLNGVQGFGTPVYDPTMIIIPEPPVDQPELNIAATINILSWNVVSQGVILGQ